MDNLLFNLKTEHQLALRNYEKEDIRDYLIDALESVNHPGRLDVMYAYQLFFVVYPSGPFLIEEYFKLFDGYEG